MDKLTPQNAEQEYMIQILLAKMQGIDVQILNSIGDWSISTPDVICIDSIYRIKPHELPITREMWAMIDEKWKWAAKDGDGEVYFYTNNPSLENCFWRCYFGEHSRCVLSIDTDDIDWRKSLTRRPEGV